MIPQEKSLLRRTFLARRDGLEDRDAKDRAICRTLCKLPRFQQANQVLLYLSKGSEPDTWEILEQALRQGKQVCAPRCLDSQGNMAFYRITSREDLAPGRFGLLEPDPAKCPEAECGEESLCLVPGLAFDREGYRLGYGKGYYDRFLAKHRVEAIGLCYGALLQPRLPRGPYDRQVDWLVTEAGVLNPREGRSPGKEGCV